MPGSIRYRGNNKWELRVSVGYDDNHKQKRVTKVIYAAKKKEADKALASFYLQVTGKIIEKQDIKFSEFVDCWKQKHESRLGIITQASQNQMLENRILPAFGHIKLNKITPDMILRFILELTKDGARMDDRHQARLSNTTIQKYFKLMNQILHKACEWGYILRNPCDAIPADMRIKSKPNHFPIWRQEDLSRFLTILSSLDETYSNMKNILMFYVSLITGARKGEFMGLTWDRVDLTHNELAITQSLKFIKGLPVRLDTPKTDSSVRTLYFDDFTRDLFIKYKKMQDNWLKEMKATNPLHLVFVAHALDDNGQARFVNGNSFFLWLKRMCIKHHLPRIAVHSIRHMAATYALSSGIPLNMVQAMMGHTSITTTAIYLHDIPDVRKNECKKLANRIQQLRDKDSSN